jgi:hypothetical protein
MPDLQSAMKFIAKAMVGIAFFGDGNSRRPGCRVCGPSHPIGTGRSSERPANSGFSTFPSRPRLHTPRCCNLDVLHKCGDFGRAPCKLTGPFWGVNPCLSRTRTRSWRANWVENSLAQRQKNKARSKICFYQQQKLLTHRSQEENR